MKCPYCFKEINNKVISKYFASRGGSISRRKLSSADAKRMAKKSAEKRRQKIVKSSLKHKEWTDE